MIRVLSDKVDPDGLHERPSYHFFGEHELFDTAEMSYRADEAPSSPEKRH
jgi:phosphotransferase system HPr-like phosphotransfer protein